jgi:hypothetical protein
MRLAEYDAMAKEFMFDIETCGEKFLGLVDPARDRQYA